MGRFIIILFSLVIIGSCTKDRVYVEDSVDRELEYLIKKVSPNNDFSHFILPDEDDLDNIPQDPMNPLNESKVQLGKFLFYETGLSLSPMKSISKGTWSCATCHVPSAGFKPGAMQGIADGGLGFGYEGENRTMNLAYEESEIDAQGTRPIVLINAAYVTNALWNGRFGAHGANEGTEDVWGVIDPVTEINHLGFSGVESSNLESVKLHRMEMDRDIATDLGYKELFDDAFPEIDVSERYTQETFALSVSAYLRTILSNQSPFQNYIKGELSALNDQEKLGAMLFFSKANCADCHNNTNLGSLDFYGLGVNDLYQRGGLNTSKDDPRILGRGGFTGEQEDMYKFKVPQLYNLADGDFFFHGSSKQTLEEVVDYFNEGVPENPNVPADAVSPIFRPLNLTETEQRALLSFLKTGLNDPNMDRYVPESLPSGNCFPNNDPFSKNDLGCE